MISRKLALLAFAVGVACAPGGAGDHATQAPAAETQAAVAIDAPKSEAADAPMTTAGRLAGSDRCMPCHPVQHEEWKNSEHARTLRVATAGDEDRLATLVPCSEMETSHVLGHRHELRFLVEKPSVAWGAGRWLALPCGWDVHEKALKTHHADDWRDLPLETSCLPCHVTRQAADWSFTEAGVGCESCHGPAEAHAAAPSKANVYTFTGRSAADEVSACGSCHLQGGTSKRTGRHFPDGWTPGENLFDDYEFDWSKLDTANTTEAIDLHQKLLIRNVVQGSDATMRCTSCHELHEMTHAKHQDLPRQDFCLTCHVPETYKLKEYRQSCPVCEF